VIFSKSFGLASVAILVELAFAHPCLAITRFDAATAGAQDVIVDSTHKQVFVTTSSGVLQRYSLTSHSLLTALNVGVNLRGEDLSADDSSLYIADQTSTATQGVIRKINTVTGAQTDLFYNLAGEGAGAYDIVRLSSNKMLFTTNHQFSGASPVVRFINLSNDTITIRPNGAGGDDAVERQTDLFRNAGGTRVFMTGGNTSAGAVRVYDAPSDSYISSANLFVPLNGITAAVSPDGNLIAFQGFNRSLSIVRASDLSTVTPLTTYRSGLGFDPQGLLFMADWQTDLFRVYDTSTLSELTTFPSGIDLDPFALGNLSFTSDGKTMVFQDPSGIHVYEGVPIPEPMLLPALMALVSIASLRRR
jgi:hypothetical protein